MSSTLDLWNIIRDFFVQYVFGGYSSTGHQYIAFLGYFGDNEDYSFPGYSTTTYFPLNGYDYAEINPITYVNFGDWLSTTATIITLIGLFIAITMFIIKLVKWISNTIAMR